MAIFCLLAALEVSVSRLVKTDWADHLDRAEFSLLLGFVLGGLLGYSLFSGRVAGWMAFTYSLISIFWQFGLLMDNDILWSERILSLSGRLAYSFNQLINNRPVTDSLLFVFIMTIVYWIIGLSGGYMMLRKGKPWVPLFAASIALIIIDLYPPYIYHRNLFSGAFVLFSLLLVGRMYFLNASRDWRENGIQIDSNAGSDLAKSVLTGSLIIVMVAWNMPMIIDLFVPGSRAQQEFSSLLQPLRDRLQNAVTALRSPPLQSGIDYFGNDLALGTETPQSDEIIFIVETSDGRLPGLNFYWRGRSYDVYQEGKWTTSTTMESPVNPPDWPISKPDWNARREIKTTFLLKTQSSRLIYLPGFPLFFSRPAEMVTLGIRDENALDAIAVRAGKTIRGGETVEGVGWVSIPTANLLMTTGEDYPDWVKEQYLQLPDNLPDSIRSLAQDVAEGKSTPFEKTTAVTQYLRDNIEYKGSIDAPPKGKDPIEWFLFESKSGYCNYYATAEVLMLRSLGIPARMTVGFAQGETDERPFTYRVLAKNSHAWPEVYFSGLGWIEFEPTSSIPITEYVFVSEENENESSEMGSNAESFQSLRSANENRLDDLEDVEIGQKTKDRSIILKMVLFVICVCGIITFGVFIKKHPNWTKKNTPKILEKLMRKRGMHVPSWLIFWGQYTSFSDIERYFYKITWMLRLLGKNPSSSQTPAEKIKQLLDVLPETKEGAEEFLEEYQKDIYSQNRGDLVKARRAYLQIRQSILSQIINKWSGL